MKGTRFLALVLVLALAGAAPGYADGAPDGAPASPDADYLFTEDELTAVMEQARDFHADWFYDRSVVIDPAYSDFTEYPPYDQNGAMPAYPVAVPDIGTYEDLLAAASVYFHGDLAEQLLAEINAQDQDGRLCVAKSDGLGGAGFTCSLIVRRLQEGYGFDLSYTMPGTSMPWEETEIMYSFADGHWAFTGEPADIHQFFIVLLYAIDLETDFLL